MIHRRATLRTVLVLAALCLPLAADGATINMILSDMDVSYFGGAAANSGSLFDTIGHPGGNLNAGEADEVETAVFEVDMTHVGTLMSSPGNIISTDLRVDGVGASLMLNNFLQNIGNNGGGFGLDWFTQSGNNLRLGIDSVDLLLTNNVFFFTGTATVLSQNLPFGLAFVPNQNVVFSFTATLPGINGAGGGGNSTTGAMGSGALTISGEAIPEPTTIALLCTVVSILGTGAIRRRAAAA